MSPLSGRRLSTQLPRGLWEEGQKERCSCLSQVIRNRYPRALKMYGPEVSHTKILEIRAWLLSSASRCWYSRSLKNSWTVGPQKGAAIFPWEGFCPEGRPSPRAQSVPVATTGRRHCPTKGAGRLLMVSPFSPLLFTDFPRGHPASPG